MNRQAFTSVWESKRAIINIYLFDKLLETCEKASVIFGLSPDMDTKMASC